MPENTLYILSGSTAVGKTELSLRWAEKNNAEILSADSLLFYKGMNIGTAKPKREELERIPHHAIDLVNVDEQYDISRYIEYAETCIEDIVSRGKKVLITGGSGFYLKAFLAPVVDNIEISKDIRTTVDQIFKFQGLDGLVEKLGEFNSVSELENIDLNNPRRVIPSLERCMETGKSLTQLRNEFENSNYPFKQWKKQTCLLTRSKENLVERVRIRADQMLRSGLIQEVEELLQLGIEKNPSASNSIGYRETIEFLKNKNGSEKELLEKIILNTTRLIKKQRTWFRTQINWHQIIDLDISDDVADIAF